MCLAESYGTRMRQSKPTSPYYFNASGLAANEDSCMMTVPTMRAVIIGAGRGRRLMPTTAGQPKCFAEVKGRRILDWIVEAFEQSGIDDICFIGGYRIESVKNEYPKFTFRHNRDWERNNILESLMHARDLMDEPFICCYSDILFTPGVIARLVSCKDDISLAVDTGWLDRYQYRTDHPPDDAEKVIARNGNITQVRRQIDPSQAYGEYIGVARFSENGASTLKQHYDDCRERYSGKPFRESAVFEKAYLIHLFQEMIERGVSIGHIDTPGEYMEVDTQQDYELARKHWMAHP